MILQFIRRDPAWKFTPWLTAAAAIAALVYTRYGGHTASAVLGGAGGLVMVLFMRAQPHQRVTFFEAALPVSGRDLWLARLLSLMAMIWFPPAATAVVLLLTGNGVGGGAAIAVIAGIVLTMGMIIILSTRVEEFAAPFWASLACPVAIAIVLVLIVAFKHAVPISVLCGAVAIIWGAGAWKRVPETFQCAPIAASAERKMTGNAAPSLPWWPIIRSLLSWQTAIIIPISLWWAATGLWFFAPMYMMMGYAQSRLTTRWTLALPISRRTMLAIATVPILLLLAGSAEFGMLTGFARQGRDLVHEGVPSPTRPTGTPDVIVNRAFWQLAPGGHVPVIQAPWGEEFRPEPARLLSLTFYNPYATGEATSRRFEEWQFGRVTSFIYGRPMTPQELAHAQRSDLHPITLRPRMQILSIGIILAIGLLWVWIVELLSWYRLDMLSLRVRTALSYSAGLILCIVILGDMLVGSDPGPVSQPALEGGLLFVSRHLSENLGIVALVAMVPAALMWWIADRQAGVSEISNRVPETDSLFGRLGSRR